jgi:hypothetical protein
MSDKRVRNLHRGELPALDALIKLLRLDSRSLGHLALEGDDLLIRSRHRLVDAVGIAQLLIGAAATEIWHVRTDRVTDIAVDTVDALHSLHASHFI